MSSTNGADGGAELAADHEYLCRRLVRTLTIGVMGLGWAWGVVLFARGIWPFFSSQWISPVLLLAIGALAYHWREHHVDWACVAALLALGLALTVAAYASRTILFLFGLTVVIPFTGVIVRPRAIAVAALIAATLVLWSAPSTRAPDATRLSLGLCLGASLALAGMLWYHFSAALEWSWSSQQRATREMLDARQRRAELRRALKALDEGYDRLARLNQELVEARREAEESRRLKAEFAANVSHELRTPINLVVGFSEMMYTAPESYAGQVLPPEYVGDVHAIYRSARHLQTLIDDILDLSRIDARHMALAREPADPAAIVAEAVETIRELVERKGLGLEVAVAPGLPAVHVDRTRVRQVLLNLISNAVRFTESGRIAVTCDLLTSDAAAGQTPAGASAARGRLAPAIAAGPGQGDEVPRHVRVRVADTGIGIASEELEKVFEEFRQVDGSSRRQHGGTGLGLAISKRFVEMHGGWMWAESELDRGSTFAFTLPVVEEVRPGTRRIDRRTGGPAYQPERSIIVLDDDDDVVQLYRRYIRRYRIVGACSTDELLRRAAELQPDLVVTSEPAAAELMTRVADEAALRGARLSVLACNAPSERRRALTLGLADYLVKPVTRDQLRAAMARIDCDGRPVLVVEDDPQMMRLLTRMLVEPGNGISVHRAYCAEEAQQILRAGAPALVLLDLSLPGMSGRELLQWMHDDDALRAVPVIVVTADSSVQVAEPLGAGHLTLMRTTGFSAAEVLSFAELVADRYPSRYAGSDDAATKPLVH